MPDRINYNIHTDVKHGPLELIDVESIRGRVTDQWFNQSLVRVNDSVVRLGVVQGEFHWHKHEDGDELFYVLDGELFVDVEKGEKGKTVGLSPGQGYLVPKGLMHRTRAPTRTSMLMIETSDVRPTGD